MDPPLLPLIYLNTVAPLECELLRALYHLDVFRRGFRDMTHNCTNNLDGIGYTCSICCVKDLFSALSIAMRDPSPDPTRLAGLLNTGRDLIIASPNKSPPPSSTSNSRTNSLGSTVNSLQFPPSLQTQLSVTKVCLACNTCSHQDGMECSVLRIDSNVVGDIEHQPSFEFGLKASLDEREFCDKPHCCGSLKIFRQLKSNLNLLTIEFESDHLISQLPLTIKPYLIFQSNSSHELTLQSLVINKPYPCTLYYHTRLGVWILVDFNHLVALESDWGRVKAKLSNCSVAIAFYSRVSVPAPATPTRKSSIKSTNSNSTRGSSSREKPNNNNKSSPTTSESIYENWPLDSDSGQGSEELSSMNEPMDGSSQTKSDNYATIKRRMNKRKPLPSAAVSVPDLRQLSLVDTSRKVSFDAQVTLVDDCDGDYIPHPIFERVMRQMRGD